MSTQLKLEWQKETLSKFNLMIEKIPLFHRNIARMVAVKRAELNAQERGIFSIMRLNFESVSFCHSNFNCVLMYPVPFLNLNYTPAVCCAGMSEFFSHLEILFIKSLTQSFTRIS